MAYSDGLHLPLHRANFKLVSPVTQAEFDEVQEEQVWDRLMTKQLRSLVPAAGLHLHPAMGKLIHEVTRLPQPIGLLSLARGGIPVGLALAEAARTRGVQLHHSALGMVRGEKERLRWPTASGVAPRSVVVLDGWTGSGATVNEVRQRWVGARVWTAALVDPANRCDIAGTREAVLCPHAIVQRSLALGMGRVRRDPSGGLQSIVSPQVASDMTRYVSMLGSASDEVFNKTQAPYAVSAPPVRSRRSRTPWPDHVRPERDRWRVGVNETWRALARRTLTEIHVNPQFRRSPDVELLVTCAAVPVRYTEFGEIKVAGIEAAPGTNHHSERRVAGTS